MEYDLKLFLLRLRGLDVTLDEIASCIVEIVKRHVEESERT